MFTLTSLILLLSLSVGKVSSSGSPTLLPCQLIKPTSQSPLTNCPSGTLFVSSTDTRANFTKIQDAITSLPKTGSATILIGAGEYKETVNVTRTGGLTLLGQLSTSSPLSNGSSNLVHVWNNLYTISGNDDASSTVLSVAPSWSASLIGAGPTGAPLQPLFGSSDFRAYNIDFENRAANYSKGQALAADISYANASFYGCTFASYQDTWYTGRNGSTYIVGGTIFGQTDYLFGFGTAWFEKVILANRACGGGLVAWKGTNLTDAPGNRYGAYISNSQIIRSPDANATTKTTGECYLGRPWNELATTIYLNTSMDASINAEGFKPWSGSTIPSTTNYAEWKSSGAGYNATGRNPAEHILTDAQAASYTVQKVFLGTPSWIDFNYVA